MDGFSLTGIAFRTCACAAAGFFVVAAQAMVGISDGGQATYSQALAVPHGIAGMEPKLALSYVEGGINGPTGVGWSVQGISSITRCPANRATDGAVRGVVFGPNDKLCLDGQRLIQTDANGAALPLASQAADAQGLTGASAREFRTEKDTLVRVRGYGVANGTDVNNGPAYFKVWTKSGQVYEYGTSPTANANAVVNAQGKPAVAVWAVSRISDTVGNSVNFKYEQRDVAWGTGSSATTLYLGHEWNISEIQYSGNKVIFSYVDRAPSAPQDAAETYQVGSKNVGIRRLQSITTYINSPNVAALGPASGAVAVKTYNLIYEIALVTKRSRMVAIKECAGGPASSTCLPPPTFAYSAGGGEAIAQNMAFDLSTARLTSLDGKYGVLTGDFNGDGRTDILRWSETGSENQLWLSNGDGTFRAAPAGSGPGQFNLTQQLFRSNGCYLSMVIDANADGLPDILRIPSSTDRNGAACGLPLQADLFVNDGANGFTQRTPSLANGTPIAFDRLTSNARSWRYCGDIPLRGGNQSATTGRPPATDAERANCRWGYGWTAGATYYLLDVNGDGLLDIITTKLDAVFPEDPGPGTPDAPPSSYLPCNACTRVFLANTQGTFDEKLDSNIRGFNIYSDPGKGGDLQSLRRSVDMNGDGLADLTAVGTPRKKQSWQSSGDGNFTSVASTASCEVPLDFNGDGRSDCLDPSSTASNNGLSAADGTNFYKSVGNFNLKAVGQELSTTYAAPVGSNYGVTIVDPDGDGRHDILRWHDDPALNVLYLSNGDGTFRAAAGFAQGLQLKHSNGKFDFITGDFTGRGFTEYLRVSDDAPTTATASNRNLLYGPADASRPDILQTVTSPTGLITRLTRMALPNAGTRYVSDRTDAANKASYPKVDITVPMEVVTTVETDTGITDTPTTKVEYAYRGLKATYSGRGMLGFREVRRQHAAANGQAQTVVTQSLQDHPYIGVASLSQTYLGDLGLGRGGQLISQTTNSYCDKTSLAVATPINTPGAPPPPCASTALIQRPYVYQTLEQGWELGERGAGVELPRVTSTNTYNDSGDPLTIVSTSSGTVLGLSQTFTKTTTNTYFANNTTGDNWVLGRLQRASVLSSVPNSLPSIMTSAGTSPSATARQGTGAAPPLNPAVLSVILQLLLDD